MVEIWNRVVTAKVVRSRYTLKVTILLHVDELVMDGGTKKDQ